jgi:Protein of unknown function (DUF4089)
MNTDQALAYVRVAADMQGLVLDDTHAAAVASHLALAGGMAALLHAADLGCEDEPAQVYCPAPFPDAEPGVPTP